ncbi:MAG: hypothetical protein WA194_05140 [Patescibacteria group bacterium]
MTTITIDSPIGLSRTHFSDMEDLAAAVEQWKFERELIEGAKKAATIPESELVNLS